jgi:hypothetical protein
MTKWISYLLTACTLLLLTPVAQAADPRPGRYIGTLTMTTSFPNTDVTRSASQQITARLGNNGRMIIALANVFDGLDEDEQRTGFIQFTRGNNNCVVRISKNNFVSPFEASGDKVSVRRTRNIVTTDAVGNAITYQVRLHLGFVRVAN